LILANFVDWSRGGGISVHVNTPQERIDEELVHVSEESANL